MIRSERFQIDWDGSLWVVAVIEPADEGGYWAYCPEVAGANGQGETIEEAKQNLASAIKLILEDHLEDS